PFPHLSLHAALPISRHRPPDPCARAERLRGRPPAPARGRRSMTVYGTFLRRHFEPVMLSVQVVVDLGVLLFACWLGYLLGEHFGDRKSTRLNSSHLG